MQLRTLKTLVIHPIDPTTSFLSEIYKGSSWTIISENPSGKFLKEQIKLHDRIIMLGHGTSYGLIGHNRYIIDSNLVYLLREKLCICIWCNANVFAEKYKLKGLNTGMIISDIIEAKTYSVIATEIEIQDSNVLFAHSIQQSINNDTILDDIKKLYIGNTNVINFNRNNLYYT